MNDYPTKTPQEREIWEFLNNHPRFSYIDVERACSASAWARTNFLRKLRREGHLKLCGRENNTHYYTVFDTEQAQIFAANKRGVKEGPMWTAMRILKTFTPDDLQMAIAASAPSLTKKDIQTYCTLLVTASYLKVLKRAKIDVNPARYQLINNTGPLPPVRRHIMVVKDGNKDKIVYAQGERL